MVDIIHKLKKLTEKPHKSFEITKRRKKNGKRRKSLSKSFKNTIIGGRFITKSKRIQKLIKETRNERRE